jgi:hypothetical protein
VTSLINTDMAAHSEHATEPKPDHDDHAEAELDDDGDDEHRDVHPEHVRVPVLRHLLGDHAEHAEDHAAEAEDDDDDQVLRADEALVHVPLRQDEGAEAGNAEALHHQHDVQDHVDPVELAVGLHGDGPYRVADEEQAGDGEADEEGEEEAVLWVCEGAPSFVTTLFSSYRDSPYK